MTRIIIGLNGLAGSGKSTVANHLAERHGLVRIRFADPLKAMLRALGLGDEEIEGSRKELPCSLLTPDNLTDLARAMPGAFEAIGIDILSDIGDGPNNKPPQLLGRTASFALFSFAGVVAQAVALGQGIGATPRLLMQMIGTEWGRELIGKNFWVNLWRAKADQCERLVAEDCRFSNEAQAVHAAGGVVVKVERPDNALNVGNHESEKHVITADYGLRNNGPIDLLKYRADLLLDLIAGRVFPNELKKAA